MRFVALATAEGRAGSITFAWSESPRIFLVTPRGYIGPRLVRRDLAVAGEFAARQDEPWWYVVDPTDAIPNPANIVFLRAVHRLPNVRGYLVVARRQPMRAISRFLAMVGGPDCVVPSLDAALAIVRDERRC